ncbi:MAG TPA: hypothetical protein VLT16_16230 [Candidatus Limnocylindrales bacterium]|nr:hypothetical protein [Candidatus Limnocylindrales bacterium]
MNCNDVRENLMDVLAGNQASPEMMAHLRQCGACAQEIDSMRKTMALLDEWQAPEPSPYFLTRLKAHVREEAQKSPAKAGLLAWVRKPALAGGLAAVLIVGGALYRIAIQTPPQPPPGTAVSDVEALDKNADLYVNTDLIDEMSGAPSDDVVEP